MNKPKHNKYVFKDLSETTYNTYFNAYSQAKRYGIRGVYVWASGAGVLGIVKEVMKGKVIQYGKEKLAFLLLNTFAYVTTPVVCMVTNVTTVVKIAKSVHSISAFVFECVEDSSNLTMLPLDLILFGQPVPVGVKSRFDAIGNFSEIFSFIKED